MIGLTVERERETEKLGMAPSDCKAVWKDRKVIVGAQSICGLGDIACALKFCDDLVNEFGMQKENIIIASSYPEKVKRFNAKNFRVISLEECSKENAVFMQIAIPKYYKCLDWSLAPLLVISEYGYKSKVSPLLSQPLVAQRFSSKSLGLGDGELGIFIDRELVEWASSRESKTSPTGIQSIQTASKGIQKAILGEEYSNEKAQLFALNSKLYFGYAFRIRYDLSFIGSVCSLNAENSKNLIVYIARKTLRSAKVYEQPLFQKTLKENKIRSFAVQKYDEKNQTIKAIFSCLVDQRQTKQILIIYGSIPHTDVKAFFKAAEKEVLVTGDQSLSEAISSNKNFIYETLGHKLKLASDINKLYAELRCKRALFMDLNSESRPVQCNSERNIYIDEEYKHLLTQHFIDAFKNGMSERYKNLDRINTKTCKDKSYFPNFKKTIDEIIQKNEGTNPPKILFVDDKYRRCCGSYLRTTIRAIRSVTDKIWEGGDISWDILLNGKWESFEKLPFNEPCIINSDQFKTLELNKSSQESKRLPDSLFEHVESGINRYMITRKVRKE